MTPPKNRPDEGTTATQPRHPGGGRRGRYRAKGRQVEARARAAVRDVLGDAPRRRDLLIEHLHRLQDRYGHLSAANLAALAEEMRLPQAEVYEVATFYAHFDVIKEGETPPPAITVRVCDSLSCSLHGAEDLIAVVDRELPGDARVVRAPCMGRCDCAPVAEVGHNVVDRATPKMVADVVASRALAPSVPDCETFETYRAGGGYALLESCRAGDYDAAAIIAALEASGLRGLGGAGFPAGRKWRFVLAEPAPRLLAVNADEGEPGTFKDRYFLERAPHRVLEGMLIAAWAIEAREVYFYLRDEYPAVREILLAEIAALETAGLAGDATIHLRRGAGAYVCGEESAMLESIEGKRGLPRHKPPFPAQVGLFGRPTLSHNVETLYWLPDIVVRGPDWFAAQGTDGHPGPRSFSVSGRVKEPGVKIAPAGITARELIEDYCGGIADGHVFKAYLPGGASGGILPASMADIPLDFGTLEEHGCFIGSAAVIVLSDQDSIRDAVRNLMRFFEDESCGQCTPCRAGTEKASKLLAEPVWDEALLRELSAAMADASICGLGQAAPNPVLCAFKYFADEIAS